MTTRQRKSGLLPCGEELWDLSCSLDRENWWEGMAMVVMPDHLHLLIILGGQADISASIRRFKGRGSVVLRKEQLAWQKEAVFEHRLRPGEETAPYLRYMLLNPYAKGLLDWDAHWKNWWCSADVVQWFFPMTNSGRPFPEWLKEKKPFA